MSNSESISLKLQYELLLRQEKEFTKQVLIVYIVNAIKLAAFTYLAIYFNHWWIALFSLVFQHSVKRSDNSEDIKGDESYDEERN